MKSAAAVTEILPFSGHPLNLLKRMRFLHRLAQR